MFFREDVKVSRETINHETDKTVIIQDLTPHAVFYFLL